MQRKINPVTEPLFLKDPIARSAEGIVTQVTEDGGIIFDGTIFYPQGGGQPGDTGNIVWDGGQVSVANTVKGDGGDIILIPEERANLPVVGQTVTQELNWQRRYRHMRIHTALHLLSVVIPLPVSGGAITAEKGRLDFNMPDAIEDKLALEAELNALISRDLEICESWITDQELEANPDLVKTMSVKPPTGQGRVRLIRIGTEGEQVDLQPCGGTHVARTSEIGTVRIGKLEKKGRQNRRVNIHLVDEDI